MGHTTFTFQANKQEFFTQLWAPESPPKAVICHVHGHGDHSGRYNHIAEAFVERGIAFMGMDHYGHGQTPGKRGHAPSYDAILDSLDQLFLEAEKQFPGIPRFLYGHSAGGNIALNHALRRKPDIKGVISSAPWLTLKIKPSSAELTLAKLMINIYPSFTQATKLPVESISRDPAEMKRYADDPLVHDKISPVFFFGCHEAGLWALEHASEFSYPLLIMHGTGDDITSHESSQEFAEKAGGGDITWKSWEGLRHEIHNEPEKTEVIATMINWVEARL
jgi:alpha-beta hydrolase superfamily lysophospholipase